MDEKIVQEVLHSLFSSLEALDTQSTAVLQFLKDKGLVNDEEFKPYLEQAGNASGVRWLAARVRSRPPDFRRNEGCGTRCRQAGSEGDRKHSASIAARQTTRQVDGQRPEQTRQTR